MRFLPAGKIFPDFPYRISLLLLCTLSIPIVLYAQSEMETALVANASLVESFSLVSPTAISPFWTLFLTSLASTLGIGNDYIVTHPLLGNWAMLLVSGLFVLITTLPNLTKVSKPIGLAAKFLENKAGIVIYVIILIAPYVFPPEGTAVAMVNLGLFDIPFFVLLMIGLAIPYYIVVMTVRYLLEILIFLSPIPFLDALFEFAKKAITFFLIVIYFLFPSFGFVLSIFIFIVAFFFFKRATRISNFFQYVYVEPILAMVFRRKQDVTGNRLPRKLKHHFSHISLAVRCLSGKKMDSIPTKNIVWLVKHETGISICQTRLFRSTRIISLSEAQITTLRLGQDLSYQIIHDAESQVKVLINNTYTAVSQEIQEHLNLTDVEKIGLARQKETIQAQGKRGLKWLMGLFSTSQITQNKRSILDD